ncbi:MAG: sugar phosphate nucleotidyltransferase [Candidatus Caldarchaeum sp.]|nr:sugar phosphate nucleotidyltransferase [Candidatus Caldarchaeum sp.]MCS7136881.1 sugar phosphate nucleotidyltransferase [Candidatus Caldarchaeum sp.]MDW7977875.1 sugar phosphate nucleotidyltransferase [Candidatus Caldarchaeum sp.]MDW8360291.1 sugar phosphate nucleotidyltransferase [Candidatus Caldarchaeum sp.]
MLKKVVVTAAGLGTRLLPTTKELPKEMLPIYVKGSNGQVVLKPLLQALYEQLYEFGFREFCFVVGRGKRAIEDHFTPDWDFVDKLEKMGKSSTTSDLVSFYRMVEDSVMVWVSQNSPRGFGDAVRTARHFVGDEDFLLCAGDTYIVSEKHRFLQRLLSVKVDGATLLVQQVDDPRQYGVVVGRPRTGNTLLVSRVVEKPANPPSNLAIMPFYVFTPLIMRAIDATVVGVGGELQLTDAIQNMIDGGAEVAAVRLEDYELRLDIGTPESYLHALTSSYSSLLGERL